MLVTEAGLTHVQGHARQADRVDRTTAACASTAPATNVSGNYELRGRHCPTLPAAQCLALNLVEPQNRFADATSYGYRVAGRLDYPGLMGPWNILPRFSWQHDVQRHHARTRRQLRRRAATASRSVSPRTCRRSGRSDMSWTKFGGAGRFNDINDRDYVAATAQVLVLTREGTLMLKKFLLTRCRQSPASSIGASSAMAAVSAADAAKLGAELTPLGAREGRQCRRLDSGLGWRTSPRRRRRASPTSVPASITRILTPATSRCTR